MAYSSKQLEAAWIRAGGPRSTAALAAAIAGAESGFGANPYGDKGLGGSGYTSFGPWQIHTPAHPQYSPARLVSDLDYSAKAAVEVSGGGKNFAPWTTYKTGAYKQYYGKSGQSGGLGLPGEGAFKKVGEVATAPFEGAFKAGETAAKVTKSLGGIGHLADVVSGWIEDPLTPVKFLGGTVLLYVGVRTLTGGTGPARETSRAVRHARELATVIPK